MFAKINLKLKLGISIFIIFVIIVENIIILISIHEITYPNFEDLTKEAVQLSYNNVESYLLLSTNYVKNTITNRDFMNQVTENKYTLNSLKIPSLSIIGVVLYNTNGNYYYSDGMGGIISFNEFKNDPIFALFMNDDSRKNMFYVRNNLIHSNYATNIMYDKSQGIISYISKIYDETENITGYLFVDINPKEIYSSFFTFEKYNNMKNTITLIKTGPNSYLHSEQNNSYSKYFDDTINSVSNDGKYLIFSTRGSFEIISLVPVQNFNKSMMALYLPIFILSIIIIIISIIFAIFYAKKIVNSLKKLTNQMNNVDNIIKLKMKNN